jgi:membrane protease YdiL (CAAX protease family)
MTFPDRAHGRDLRGFLNRGGFWRLVLVLAIYLAIYLGAGRLLSRLAGHFAHDDLLGSVGSVFFQITASLLVGAIVLLAFSQYMGWTKQLFARQPIYRAGWMWIAPVVVLVPVVLRVFGIDWGKRTIAITALILATGLLIGFVEELVYRGIAVKMLRDGGHAEWAVAALSSLLFALSHSVNLLSGQPLSIVGPTVLYTFAFGVLMYLTLRSTGLLAAAMILHGLTDPTTILATGGVDEVKLGQAPNALLTGAGVFTAVLIATGFILLLFIRGQAHRRNDPAAPKSAEQTG